MNRKFYALIIALLLFSVLAISAKADTIVVSKTADTNNPLPCSDCSLREAINTINESPFTGVSRIDIAIPQSDPNCNAITQVCTISLTLGSELLISSASSLIIDGGTANHLIIDGLGATRIFRSLSNLTIRNLTLQRGNGVGGATGFSGSGSAIFMNGTISGASLTLDHVVIQNNDSTFTTSGSGSVYLYGGANHSISNSTLSGNMSASCAGFVLNGLPSSTLSVVNTTVSFNTALQTGGGLCTSQFGTTSLRNVTIADNTAFAGGGGGITVSGGTLNLASTIVAHNVSNTNVAPDIRYLSGTLATQFGNLIGNNATAATQFPAGQPNGSFPNGDWVGDSSAPINPLLAPLGNAGGTTPTRPLYSLSLANNNGGGSVPANQTDQRGALRGATVDIGAFEANSVPYT
ncbi:MAG: CSLREA domain-containing protein, partial [Pyrinomonadaceae bacterium]